jgi:hypothetical protein
MQKRSKVHPQCIVRADRKRESAKHVDGAKSPFRAKTNFGSASTAPRKRKKESPMKNRILVMTSLLMLCSLAATQVARAQDPLSVNIPFAFVAGETNLPAGEYRVQKMDRNSAVLLIRCDDPRTAIMVVTNATRSGKQQEQSKLVFHKYGEHYFLSQVWTAGFSSGRELLKTQREKEISLSAKQETPNQVILLASISQNKQ